MIDPGGQHSWSTVVPSSLSMVLSATNAAYTQNGQSLYICGGYTRSDPDAPNFNTTSNTFLEINLSALIGYVQTGGNGNPLSSVITKQIQSPYVQVTGGALMQVGSYFILSVDRIIMRSIMPELPGITPMLSAGSACSSRAGIGLSPIRPL